MAAGQACASPTVSGRVDDAEQLGRRRTSAATPRCLEITERSQLQLFGERISHPKESGRCRPLSPFESRNAAFVCFPPVFYARANFSRLGPASTRQKPA